MQKIFMKFTIAITSIAIFSILVINLMVTANGLKQQQLATFQTKIAQVIHTLKNNRTELDVLMENLDEDYLTRARAAAYIIEKNPDVLEETTELINMAELLDVDEIHVTGREGIILYSSVNKYLGVDFHIGEQVREFLPLIESYDSNAYFIQDAMPNTAEGKMMKYIGVSRRDQDGMVQVGLEPVRQLEAQERNTYEYIFSRFPTDMGEELFAIDIQEQEVIASTLDRNGQELTDGDYDVEILKGCGNGSFQGMPDGSKKFIVTRIYGNILICAALSEDILQSSLFRSVLRTFLYLVLIEILVLFLMNYLIRKKVVAGIHGILGKLDRITGGDLDTIIKIGGNPELEALSTGINTMVKSIVNTTDRISKVVDMMDIPLAAFEYDKNMNCVFITSQLKELLHLSKEEADCLYNHPKQFLQKIEVIMETPVPGETDIYCVHGENYISIRLSVEKTGYYGVIMDVTDSMLEKKRMKYENNHDQLTGLSRYAYFKKQAKDFSAQQKKDEICACVMLDLDAFKRINDTHGHDMGDKYLKRFAEVLKQLPQEHCIAARRSGDEFCMFLYGCQGEEEIQRLLDEFWTNISACRVEMSGGQICSMSVSGGYALMDAGEDVDTLLGRADEALYAAKRANKGNYSKYETNGKCIDNMK